MPHCTRTLPDETATLAAGEAIGCLLAGRQPAALRLHVHLMGDLGAGKTTLVRGVLRGLGYTGRVKSPTYPLLETYQVGQLAVAHFDLYRLESPEAFIEAGFDEYVAGPGVCFVEWPDRASGRLPAADWSLALTEIATGGRQITLEAHSTIGAELLGLLDL